MNNFQTLESYITWHYAQGVKDLTNLWGNFIAFFWHFFSIPLLLRTLFSPWRRMDYKTREQGLHVGQFLGDMIISILMRICGFLVRVPTILLGLILLVSFVALYPIVIVLWLILPLLSIFLLVFGFWVMIVGL